MFKLYKEYYNGFYGIWISKSDIKIGDKNFINKLKHIKIDDFENKYILAFKLNASLHQIELFIDMFNDEFKHNTKNTLSNIIKKFSDLFDVFETNDSINNLVGLITEITFIYACNKHGINIENYYQYNLDKYDISLPEGNYIELKHINELDKTIIISDSQLSNLKDNDLIVGIRLFWDSINGVDIYWLLNQINLNRNQRIFIEEQLRNFSDDDIKKRKINIERCDFRVIERKRLPYIEQNFKTIIVEAKYRIMALSLNADNEEFFKIIGGKFEN